MNDYSKYFDMMRPKLKGCPKCGQTRTLALQYDMSNNETRFKVICKDKNCRYSPKEAKDKVYDAIVLCNQEFDKQAAAWALNYVD